MLLDESSARACSIIVSGGVYWSASGQEGLIAARDGRVVQLNERQARSVRTLLRIEPSPRPAQLKGAPRHIVRMCACAAQRALDHGEAASNARTCKLLHSET